MIKENYIPNRGDIVYLDFSPTKGHEQKGSRPAFVISPILYNRKSGLCVVAPITSKGKSYPFEVVYKGPKYSGFILADQLRTVDFKIRKVKFIEKCNNYVINEVIGKAVTLLS